MADPSAGLASQLRNIEAEYGKTVAEWVALIRASGKTRHGEIVAWLKSDHAVAHMAARRLASVALDAEVPAEADPVDALYAGPKAALRPIHDRIVSIVQGFGEVELLPKKGYVSLRRRTQLGLVQPGTKTRVDLGLQLPGVEPTGRLEASGTFNALVTHRVRLATADEVDREVDAWLKAAWERAG